jgi:hypothetical protein
MLKKPKNTSLSRATAINKTYVMDYFYLFLDDIHHLVLIVTTIFQSIAIPPQSGELICWVHIELIPSVDTEGRAIL